MSTVPELLLTSEEYLARERQASFRSEFYRGEMFAMAGAGWPHTLIKDNMSREAGNCLRDGPCQVVTSDLRVKISATGLYTYPDLVVVCDEPQFEDQVQDTLLNPLVIVEVLSDSTEKYDRGTKFSHYRQLPSVQEYVMVAQNRLLIERYVRQTDDSWLLTVFGESADTFDFASIGASIPMSAIYRGVKLPDDADR